MKRHYKKEIKEGGGMYTQGYQIPNYGANKKPLVGRGDNSTASEKKVEKTHHQQQDHRYTEK